jgi:carboxylate-amine ligase
VLERAAEGEHELRREQVEAGTQPRETLAQVREALVRNRRDLSEAAGSRGLAVVATGAAWISPDQVRLTDEDRYRRMAETFGPIARRQLVDGCHVHVGMPDRAAAIEVVNRVRPWLAVLLALSANSPFWDGEDTGYASYRHEVWSRWPTAGTPGPFADIADYTATIEQLIRSGAAVDAGMIYFHVRPSAQWPTVEFRIADVCLTVDEAVLTAALSRALAVTALTEAQAGEPVPEVRSTVLRAAQWRAARYGLDGALVSVLHGVPRPAAAVVEELLEHVAPALDAAGDSDDVHRLVEAVLSNGNGAHRQRHAYRRRQRFEDVVALLIEETAS